MGWVDVMSREHAFTLKNYMDAIEEEGQQYGSIT
jgi:hypothetical protein